MRLFLTSLSAGISETLTDFKIVLDDSGEFYSYISSVLNDKELKQNIEPFRATTNTASNNLDYGFSYLDDVQIRLGEEDCAPSQINGLYIGGNHGYYGNKLTSVGNDKAQVDVGSIWNDGTYDFVLTAIDGDDLYVSHKDNNFSAVANSPLTHVSGATNTSNLTFTVGAFAQIYPCSQNKSLVLKVDGTVMPITNNTHLAQSDIVFEESYDILDKNSMMQWLIDNVGNVPVDYQPDANIIATITNKIRYTRFGNTLENSIEAKATIPFGWMMFIMGFTMSPTATYPNLKHYIPKTLPFTQDSVDYDFANMYDAPNGLYPANAIDIDSVKSVATGISPDRHLMLLDGIGFSMGYLPIKDADPSVRRLRCNNKFMQIAANGKLYPNGVDDDSKTQLVNGDFYSVTAYKNFFDSSADRTAYYIVDGNDGDFYLYADWHNLPYSDTLDIPSELIGKTIELIEKSDNVSYTGSQIGSTLDVTITDSETYGYLILKL